MLRNYLAIALRTLRKQPGYTLINVGGLGLGLACCFLIVLFIQHELSYDAFHEKGDRIVRLTRGFETVDQRTANSASGYAPILQATFPEVEHAVRFEHHRSPYLRVGQQETRRVKGMALADTAFFQVFGFDLLRGNPATVLDGKYNVVLSETTARSLFGEADPMGQTITYNDRFDLTVTGIMADVPDNSHLQFNYVGSFLLMPEFMGENALADFTNYNYYTYLLLRPGTDVEALEAKITQRMREQFGEESTYVAGLQPLDDIHFNTTLLYDTGTSRDIRYLYVFGAIGLFILLIACVNFMNLATARATQRAKEVGVRKTLGSTRPQLIGQFLGESVVLSVLAIALGLGLATALMPVFNEAIGVTTTFDLARVGTLTLLVGIGLVAGLLAGSYPAFYLSAFHPARVLKGDVHRGRGAPLLRKGLIVFQFAISAFMIVATLTVYNQLRHMQSQDLGFDKERVVFLSPAPPIRDSYETFRQELLARPRVTNVARGYLPGRVGTNRGYNWPGQGGDEQGDSFWTLIAEPGYLETLDIDLVAGRDFSWSMPTDTHDTYILNEAAVEQLGWTNAVGKPFRAWDRPMGTVIGVVDDFHFQSLHQQVQPVVINYKPNWLGTVVVRLAPGDVSEALDAVRATWRTFAAGYAFDYTFLDEDYDRLYRSEERLAKLFGVFAGLAILIACLGLFGLAAYMAQQRTKEIGVRKVLGASVTQIVALLSKDFAVLVLIGLVVATPLAYVVMQRWLSDFAYHTALGPETFLLAGVLALLIAFLTVSYQAWRAATVDPVQSLRYG
jgi:putative ABC transport system permease protein